eukprot:TRINITY_DN37637_c0_g1_i1.p1 TRINITY_DN37637_c0_g1~~TRINITY_DN37637_c0_g1_i1.p1  ORF type:complete len:350 (+),score=40.90 TRINITY_DN37637_c0_g1_i1:55-1050(+)
MNVVTSQLLLCTVYLLAGPALILLNKHIMQSLDFGYPITLSGLGMVAASLTSWGLIRSGVTPMREETSELLTKSVWIRTCLPVGICKAATLTFGNAAYMELNLGFIQMLKAFSPVVVLITGAVLNVESPKGGTILSVSLICAGTVLTSGADPSSNIKGLLLFCGASTTEAINLVLTQFLLQNKSFSVIEGQYVLAPPGVLFLFLAAATSEWKSLLQNGHHLTILNHPFMFLAAALLGLAINLLTFQVVKSTSSLTLKILGMVRNVALIFVGIISYKEVVPPIEIVGFLISLSGFTLYHYFKANPSINSNVGNIIRAHLGLRSPPDPDMRPV